MYRDPRTAQERLQRLENHYKRKNFANMREEQQAVNEIDRLKRNITKLGKYMPLVEERRRLDEKIKNSRQQLRVRLELGT